MRKKRTLASKLGVSQKKLGRKIAKVVRHHPEKTPRQAAGMAKGILQGEKRKPRKKKH